MNKIGVGKLNCRISLSRVFPRAHQIVRSAGQSPDHDARAAFQNRTQ